MINVFGMGRPGSGRWADGWFDCRPALKQGVTNEIRVTVMIIGSDVSSSSALPVEENERAVLTPLWQRRMVRRDSGRGKKSAQGRASLPARNEHKMVSPG